MDTLALSPNNDPSVALAAQVMQYVTVTYQAKSNQTETVSLQRVVVGFDKELFFRKCHPSSEAYDPNIDFNLVAHELFKKDETWASRDGVLEEAVNELAKYHAGFTTKKVQEYVRCNRFGDSGSETSRNFASGSLASGCTFFLKLKALSKNAKLKLTTVANKQSSASQTEAVATKERWQYQNIWTGPITIIDKCCVHGGLCEPSKQNRIHVMQRAGKYVSQMPCHPLYTLCNHLNINGDISTDFIKCTIQPTWPSSKNITKQDVYNIKKVRIKRLLPIYKNSRGDFEAFQALANSSDLLRGIEDMPTLDDDEAYELAQSAWRELESTDTNNNADSILSFTEYLEVIKSKAKGFCYDLARDNTMKHKPLIGILWQTATMHRNYELFGGYLCLDMMKRGINKLLWPYAAVAMYDDQRQVCIACEGILQGEQVEMYKFIANFLGKNSLGRPLASVNVVAGDGFFDQDMISDLGFTNARYVTDKRHLIESGLRNKFGAAAHDLLNAHLLRMINAVSEREFDDTLLAAHSLLQSMPSQNGEWKQKLDEFASQRESYARYCLNNIPGNRGIQGSSASESNHSSVLSHLNRGNRFGNQYCATQLYSYAICYVVRRYTTKSLTRDSLENLTS